MLANLKNVKQAVLLNLDNYDQVRILGSIPLDQESNSVDLESLSNGSAKKVFKTRKNRSASSKKAKLVYLEKRSASAKSKKSTRSNKLVNLLDDLSLDSDVKSDLQKLVIDLSDDSSHKQQVAQAVMSEDTHSLDNSLENLSDDGFMNAYCRSLGYSTKKCRKWAGYSTKSKSTNIASAKSDSDDDNKSVSSFSQSDDSEDGPDTNSESALSEYLMQLNMFSKMGNGLKKFKDKAIKARDMAEKYAPMADKAFAVVAPEHEKKYKEKFMTNYSAFNNKANQYGGWNTVDMAADTMQSMGLIQLTKSQTQILCD